MKEYCERMEMPIVENWDVYMAFSFFRVCAILQGVYSRALKGTDIWICADSLSQVEELLRLFIKYLYHNHSQNSRR